MNRIAILLIFIGLNLSGVIAQVPADTLSSYHQLVPGTNIYIVPPKDFQLSENFKGFQNPDDPTSMIMLMEIPGPFSEATRGFTSEYLKPRGMDLTYKKEITFQGYNGLLLGITQSANGMDFMKHLLIFGNDASTTMVNGIYLKDSIALGESIEESVLSTFVQKDMKANPREVLDYSINERIGGLQFHSVIGNGLLLNRDLKTPTESPDQATLITDRSFATNEIANKKLFCLNRLRQFPDEVKILEDKGINEVVIDGLSGYELYAINEEEANNSIYQVILFKETGGYYIFMGSYHQDYPEALEDIKKVIWTFTQK